MTISYYVAEGYVTTGYVAQHIDPVLSMRQYDNSPVIQSLLNNWSLNLDIKYTLDIIYRECVDIDTCTGYWLDLWGVKVGVGRVLQIPSSETSFGFNESGNDWLPFNDGVFYVESATQAYSLSDDAYRSLILSKAAYNITSCSSRAINQWLDSAYAGRGDCYCVDNDNMTAIYYFDFPLEIWEISVLTQGKVLPRPAGVSVTLNVLGTIYNVN